MGLLTLPQTIDPNTLADADEVQEVFNAIATVINGNINNDNIADAGINAQTKVAALSVKEANIANLAVTTAKIADGAITNDKLDDDAVGQTSRIKDLVITFIKMASGSYIPQLAFGTYDGDGLATQAITLLAESGANIPFRPKGLIIWIQDIAAGGPDKQQIWLATTVDGTSGARKAKRFSDGRYDEDVIISFDATPGFTVGDGSNSGANVVNHDGSTYGFAIFNFA